MGWEVQDPGRYSWSFRNRQGRSGGRRDSAAKRGPGCLYVLVLTLLVDMLFTLCVLAGLMS